MGTVYIEIEKKSEVKFIKSSIKEDLRLITGIVYEPDVVDSQGDWASADTIREAAHDFMKHSQIIKVQHEKKVVDVDLVENYIAPVDFKIGKKIVKEGTWLQVVKVDHDDLWSSIKAGEFTGFSMGGRAAIED